MVVLKTVECLSTTVTQVTIMIAASRSHKYALLAFSAEHKDPHCGPRRLIIVLYITSRGRMYEQRIFPLIAFIFYPPFKMKKQKQNKQKNKKQNKPGMYEARLGLSGRPKRV